MSSEISLELCRWNNDNKLRLTYWDNLHGNDIVYRIVENGDIFLENIDDDDEMIDNFGLALIALIDRIKKDRIEN